jgi:hypothetical protein
MPKIKNLASDEVITVAETPVWSGGVWECGDRRFVDVDGTDFEPVQPAPVPPTVGPIAFQLLWTEVERVAIDDLVTTNKAVANFKRLLDDPRTDAVVMALPSIQNSIQTTLQALVDKGTITEADVEARKAQILSGQMQ